MSTTSDATVNYDAKKFLTAPYTGLKGKPWEDFKERLWPALLTLEIKDPNEIYDLAETLQGTDDSGEPQGFALPATAAATRRRTTRLKRAYGILYTHVLIKELQRAQQDV